MKNLILMSVIVVLALGGCEVEDKDRPLAKQTVLKEKALERARSEARYEEMLGEAQWRLDADLARIEAELRKNAEDHHYVLSECIQCDTDANLLYAMRQDRGSWRGQYLALAIEKENAIARREAKEWEAKFWPNAGPKQTWDGLQLPEVRSTTDTATTGFACKNLCSKVTDSYEDVTDTAAWAIENGWKMSFSDHGYMVWACPKCQEGGE